jgi:hypothetical protein
MARYCYPVFYSSTKTWNMSDRNQKNNKERNPDEMADKGRGMQGIDKAPGEEPAQTTEQVTWESQRGKNKVDGDPSKPSDQPIDLDQPEGH